MSWLTLISLKKRRHSTYIHRMNKHILVITLSFLGSLVGSFGVAPSAYAGCSASTKHLGCSCQNGASDAVCWVSISGRTAYCDSAGAIAVANETYINGL